MSTGNQSTVAAAAAATAIASGRWRSTRRLTTKKDNDEKSLGPYKRVYGPYTRVNRPYHKSTDREKREGAGKASLELTVFG